MSAMPIRREEIMARSAELFASKGIAATTVRDIGDVTGLLSGSLYHHFKSKNAIVSAVLGRFMDDIHRRFAAVTERSPSPAATVRGLVLETLRVIEDHPHPTAIYQNDRQYLRDHGLLEPVKTASRAVRTYWITAIEAGIADGTFRADIPAELFYRTVRDTLWATMHWPNRARYSTSEFATLLADLFFDGLAVGNASGRRAHRVSAAPAGLSPSSARASPGTRALPPRPPRRA